MQRICKVAEYYVDKLFAYLAHSGFYMDNAKVTDKMKVQVRVALADVHNSGNF